MIAKDECRLSWSADLERMGEDHALVSYDLEQILQLPKLANTKQAFYKSRLVMFNLTFFLSNNKQGYCYTWTQVEGWRGGNDIATAIGIFMREHMRRFQTVTLWSDSCPSQNKNRQVVSSMCQVSSETGQQIHLKYFEPGHTKMNVDNMHARIELHSRPMEIATPGGWIACFETAKKNGEPYVVRQLKHWDFINYTAVANVAFRNDGLKGIQTQHLITVECYDRPVVSWSASPEGPAEPIPRGM